MRDEQMLQKMHDQDWPKSEVFILREKYYISRIPIELFNGNWNCCNVNTTHLPPGRFPLHRMGWKVLYYVSLHYLQWIWLLLYKDNNTYFKNETAFEVAMGAILENSSDKIYWWS